MKKATGFDYLSLALLAFGGIGLEVVLAYVIEPFIYGAQMGDWTVFQHILHWIATCVVWGAVGLVLIREAKKKYDFDILVKGQKVAPWQWVLIGVFVVGSLMISYFDWNGSKVLKEFYANGWLKFIFQYIYYVFETFLIVLILIFAQKAFETWFRRENIPYGGIIVAVTWGLAHIFTKSLAAGIVCAISGFGFGSVYLLTNRDIRKTFPIIFIMFAL